MHLWKRQYPCTVRFFSSKHSSFVTGRYPRRIVARFDCLRRIFLLTFPTVMYTGHPCLSPANRDRFVLSEEIWTGDTVAPTGSLPCRSILTNGHSYVNVTNQYLNASTCLDLPPPVTCCHLIVHPVFQVLVLVMLFRSVFHPILECRVPNQLSNTFHWVPSPQLNFLDDGVAVFILAISSDLEDFACPLWTLRKAINFLEERVFVLRG